MVEALGAIEGDIAGRPVSRELKHEDDDETDQDRKEKRDV